MASHADALTSLGDHSCSYRPLSWGPGFVGDLTCGKVRMFRQGLLRKTFDFAFGQGTIEGTKHAIG